MARRRIQSQSFTGANRNFGQSDLLKSLASLESLGEDPESFEDFSLRGTAQEIADPEDYQLPQVPKNPEMFEDQWGVDDVPGIPEGVELLGDLAESEAAEDTLDYIGDPEPPVNFLLEEQGSSDDPMEFVEDRVEAEPDLAQFMHEGDQQPQPQEMSWLDDIGEGFADIWENFADYFSPEKRKEAAESNAKLFEDNALRAEAKNEGMSLEEYKTNKADEYGQDQRDWQQQISEAVLNPYERSVYGATDTVLNTPQMREQLQTIGIDPNPEEERMLNDMDAALSEMNEQELRAQGAWNEQVQRIRDRIESGQATDMDKFLIGITLLMPLIVGGVFGAEAGLSTFGGVAEGLMKAYENREKSYQEDEKRLTDLTEKIEGSKRKQSEIDLQRAKLPMEVKKSVGASPMEHLKGMQLVNLTNEEGEQVQGVELKPGIIADTKFLNDKEALKEMRKEALEINQNRATVNKLGNSARRVIDIAQQMDDPNVVKKIFQGWAKDKKPSIVAKFGEDIILDGRKVNSAVALTQALEEMLESRRNAQKIKNFGPQLFEHFERILTTPIGEFNTPQDLIDQTLRLYTDTRDQFLDEVEQRGFLREGVLDDFYGKDKAMFDLLNKKESMSREDKEKRRRMTTQVDVPNG